MELEKIKKFGGKLAFFIVSLLVVAVGALLMRQKDSVKSLSAEESPTTNKTTSAVGGQAIAETKNAVADKTQVPTPTVKTKTS